MEQPQARNVAQRAGISRIGPEQPTLAEKFVGILHLPYALGCIIWALVLFELPAIIVFLVDPTLQLFSIGSPDIILYLVVMFILAIYFPLSVRFVRARVRQAEFQLVPVLPNGEADYHDAFARAVSHRGQIGAIIAIALMAVFVVMESASLTVSVFNAVCAAYVAIMLGCLIWFSLGCVVGMYHLGGRPFKYKSFRQDPRLGVRPIGSLALSLAGAYFVGIIILILLLTFAPVSGSNGQLQPDVTQNRSNDLIPSYLWGVYAFLILVGLTMFFLPLLRVHVRMADEKSRQDSLIQSQIYSVTRDLKSGEQDVLADIKRILSLEMAGRKLQSVSTWPFDTTILGKLSVILLSVMAAIIARGLWGLFGLPTK